MLIEVKKESLATKRFFAYVIQEILRHEPLVAGEAVKVLVIGDPAPAPEFERLLVEPTKAGAKTVEKIASETDPQSEGGKIRQIIGERLADRTKIIQREREAIIRYLDSALIGLCAFQRLVKAPENPENIVSYMLIQNPQKIRAQSETSLATVYLNNAGDLWREPKEGHCYQIGESSNRHKIIRLLLEDADYRPTSDIATKLDNVSNVEVSEMIGKINHNVLARLKLSQGRFIEGKKGSGYRINPKYKIVLVRL